MDLSCLRVMTMMMMMSVACCLSAVRHQHAGPVPDVVHGPSISVLVDHEDGYHQSILWHIILAKNKYEVKAQEMFTNQFTK